MKRKFTLLAAALMLLAFITPPLRAVGQITYTKITTAPDDWSGTYVIVADESSMIFTGQSGSSTYGGNASVTITDGTVTGNFSTYEVEIAQSGSYYYIKHTNSGKYLGWENGNNLHFNTSTPSTNAYRWVLSTSSILNANDNSRKLQYNSSSPRFACYTSSQKVAYLYKKAAAPVETPTFSPVGGVYTSPQSVTISCEAGASIYYTTDGTDPTNSSTPYTGAISVSSNMTLKAIAYNNNSQSSYVGTATYTILTPLTSMQQIFNAATTTITQVAIAFDNWVISGQNGSQTTGSGANKTWLTDNNGKGCVINDYNPGLMAYNVLNGTVICNLQRTSYGYAQITGVNSTTTDINGNDIVSTGGTVTPVVATIGNLSGVNTGAVVKLNHLRCTSAGSSSNTLTDGINTIYAKKTLYSLLSLEKDKFYDLTGIFDYSTSTSTIYPRTAEDVVRCPEVTASPSSLTVPSYVKNTPENLIDIETLTVNGTNLRGDITVALEKGSSSDFEISEDSENWGYSITIDKASGTVNNKAISVRLKAGRDVNSYSDKIIINSTDATTVEVNVSGSVTYLTLTYNGNTNDGGSAPAAVENCTYNQAITLAGNTNGLTKTGYTFDGWNTKADYSGTPYAVGATLNITENTMLYAKWTAINYNITKSAMTNGDVTVKIGDDVVTTATIGQTVTLTVAPAANYELDNLTVTRDDNGEAVTVSSNNSFTMPASAVTVSAAFVYMNFDGTFLKVSADLANLQDGGYYILYNTKAMNSTVSGGQMGSTAVTIEDDIITNPNRAIVWKLVKNGDNWTLYSEREKKYCYIEGTNTSSFKMNTSSSYSFAVTIHNGGFMFNTTHSSARLIHYDSNLFKSYAASNNSTVDLYKYTVLIDRTITFNGNGGTYNDATTYTQSVYDGIQTNLNTNQFTRANYVFAGWATSENGDVVYADGAAITVTDADLTLYAKWNALYTATVDGSITGGTVKIDNGGVPVNNITVVAGTVVNLTETASEGYAFKAWDVYKADDATTKITVTNNQFAMPEYNVIISAEFHNKYTITFSVNGNTTVVDPIEVTIGQPADLSGITATMEGFTFAGWSLTESGAVISNTYTPTANVTLYAVFTINTSVNMVINSSTQNFPTSYGSANTFTEYTLNGKRFKIQQGYISGDKLQWRASGNSNGTGTMYNSENFGRITSVVLVYDASDNNKNFTINAGTTENPTSGTSITPSPSGNTYTFDLSDGNYTYFVMTNGSGAGYLSSITIYYTGNATVTFTNITENTNRSTNIPANEVVTVKNGATLTFTGTNNGTTANLIIEDGGQLITGVWVNATVKKNITAYTSADDGWNLISSPVNTNLTAAGIGLTTETTYDLYYLNEGTSTWINYKGSINPNFSIQPSKGYLYSNAANTPLSFSGSLQPYLEDGYEVNLTKAGEGWNLVGNPFPFNAYVNKSYYVINGRTVEAYAGSDPVPTCTGIIVKATANNEKVTFRRTAFTDGAVNNGNLQMTLSQQVTTRGNAGSATIDNAIVSFNEGSELGKFYFGEQDANLYIPQGNEEYAIATSNAQGEMPINFRANENGQYTLTVNAESVEMNYLHLIDNMTGADIDLLATPSYTFNAKTTDYESRFRLVFAANNEDGSSTGSETFTFYSNGSWVISNEGEATLQVIDALGRILSNEEINGSVSKSIDAPAGVYVLRLINGDNVKTQKIVVR